MSADEDREAAEPVPTPGDVEPGDVDPWAPDAAATRHGSHQLEGFAADAGTYQRFDCSAGGAVVLSEAVAAAAQALDRGDCVVLPTDTVYGIGADAFSPDAVQRLLDAKGRGRDMPPPVLIADAALIRVLAVDVPQEAKDLVAKHWPGPLTVILRAQPSLRMDLGEADGTIALRVPDHELTREVLRQTGPLAVSSANLSGRPAAVTCDEAVAQLGDSVAVYLDGGRLGTGDPIPSTMVDFTQFDTGQVLRSGALSTELLRQTLPDVEDLASPPVPAERPGSDQDAPAEGSRVTGDAEGGRRISPDSGDARREDDERPDTRPRRAQPGS